MIRVMCSSLFLAMLMVGGCEKNGAGPGGKSDEGTKPDGGNASLFTSFKVPGWSERIDCSHLSFQPETCMDSIHYVTATSQSTKFTFHVAFPLDSATCSRLQANERFPLRIPSCRYAAKLQDAITFMVSVPESKGAKRTWGPLSETSEDSFALLKSITYVKSDSRYAHFRITGSYSQRSGLADETGQRVAGKETIVTGEFQVMVLADRIAKAE